MIELRLRRPLLGAVVIERTVGELDLDGVPVGTTREVADRGLDVGMSVSELRARKVIGNTAIPTGRYRLALYHSGQYGRDTLAVLDVPVFFGVLLHDDATDVHDLGGNILLEPPTLATLKQALVPRMRAGDEAWLTVERSIQVGGVPAPGQD